MQRSIDTPAVSVKADFRIQLTRRPCTFLETPSYAWCCLEVLTWVLPLLSVVSWRA